MLRLAHLQLLDSAFPIGAFSHSFGLETLIQEKQIQTADDLRAWCEAMLYGVWAPCDALAVKANYVWAAPEDWVKIWELDMVMHTARAASETREGSRKIGKRLLQLGCALHPDLDWEPPQTAIEQNKCVGAFPTIYGWACRQLGVWLDDAATGFLYVCLSGCVNNAVRAMRLGQTDGQKIIAALVPQIEGAWDEVREYDPREFSSNLPFLEIAQMRHERLYSRLFMS